MQPQDTLSGEGKARLVAAAEQGDAEAMLSLAQVALAAGDGEGAVHWLRRSAEAGERYADALLGLWQIVGFQLDVDVGKGLERIEQAASVGEGGACALLAWLYATGLAVEQNWDSALDWLVEAGRLGNPRALTQLGMLVADDAPAGMRVTLWWVAATWRFSPAQLALGRALSVNEDERFREVGAAWIGTAAAAGNPRAAEIAGASPPMVKPGPPLSVEGIDFAAVRAALRLEPWFVVPEVASLRDSPRIQTAKALLSPEVCEYLAGLAAPLLRPATVNEAVGGGEVQHQMRTNSYMQFDIANSDVLLALVNHRVALFAGEPVNQQENTAVLRYRPGETYADHYDFIDPDVPHFQRELAERGQRVATALVYLNDAYAGGETAFPRLGLRYRGRPGDAIVFRNVKADGGPDRRMLHVGQPPRDREKWLLSTWIRDRPQLGRIW